MNKILKRFLSAALVTMLCVGTAGNVVFADVQQGKVVETITNPDVVKVTTGGTSFGLSKDFSSQEPRFGEYEQIVRLTFNNDQDYKLSGSVYSNGINGIIGIYKDAACTQLAEGRGDEFPSSSLLSTMDRNYHYIGTDIKKGSGDLYLKVRANGYVSRVALSCSFAIMPMPDNITPQTSNTSTTPAQTTSVSTGSTVKYTKAFKYSKKKNHTFTLNIKKVEGEWMAGQTLTMTLQNKKKGKWKAVSKTSMGAKEYFTKNQRSLSIKKKLKKGTYRVKVKISPDSNGKAAVVTFGVKRK